MDKLLDLAISYPDFQLNQIIDPEQTDLNNAQIVTKINQLVTSINAMTQGETGAGNITIKPLPEFPSAKTIQQALEQIATYCKANNTTIQTILAKNIEQDNRLNAIEVKDREQDNRLSSHDGTLSNHGTRINTLETTSSSHNQRIGTLETRANTNDTKNKEQDDRLTAIETKNNQQDRDIVALQVYDDALDRRVSSTEAKDRTQDTQISKLQSDVSQIVNTNTNAEVIDARTDITGTIHTTLKKRIDETDIGVGTTLSEGQRGKMNMLLTSSNDTEFWEDGVAIGSLNDHNNSPNAHTTLIANHELDDTSHQDIRDAINAINPVVNWEGIQNKPVTFPPAQHQHNKADIKDFPTSMPPTPHDHVRIQNHNKNNIPENTYLYSQYDEANNSFALRSTNNISIMVNNADTVDGKHASDFAPKMVNLNNYWGMVDQGGADQNWIRSTKLGFIGHAPSTSSLGTSSWKWKEVYTDSIISGGVNLNTEISNLKQSVVSGKQTVVNAIDKVYGSATGLTTNNTFSEYAWWIERVPKSPSTNRLTSPNLVSLQVPFTQRNYSVNSTGFNLSDVYGCIHDGYDMTWKITATSGDLRVVRRNTVYDVPKGQTLQRSFASGYKVFIFNPSGGTYNIASYQWTGATEWYSLIG